MTELKSSCTDEQRKNILYQLQRKYNSILCSINLYQDAIETGVLLRTDYPRVSIKRPMRYIVPDRNISFALNKWQHMSSILKQFFITDDNKLLDIYILYIYDWWKHKKSIESNENAILYAKKQENFLWYDMAVGLRALHLSLISELIQNNIIQLKNKDTKKIEDISFEHINNLKEAKNLGRGNHAIWQMLGLAVLSKQYKTDHVYQYALGGLLKYISEAFTDEYFSIEGSAYYHLYNVNLLHTVALFGIKELNITIEKCIKSGNIATDWLRNGQGSLYSIGDTDKNIKEKPYKDTQDIHFSSCLDTLVKDFSRSGYIFTRNTKEYLAFYTPNSDMHGHIDHLSFIFSYENREFFSDPGKYTYQRNALRKYFLAESSHNTCGMAGEQTKFSEIIRDCSLNPPSIVDNTICLQGFVRRNGVFSQTRKIAYQPHKKIIIEDLIDNQSENNTELRFIFAKEVTIKKLNAHSYLLCRDAVKIVLILDQAIFDVQIYKGQSLTIENQTEYLGWESNAYHHKQPTFLIHAHTPAAVKSIQTQIILAPEINDEAQAAEVCLRGGEIFSFALKKERIDSILLMELLPLHTIKEEVWRIIVYDGQTPREESTLRANQVAGHVFKVQWSDDTRIAVCIKDDGGYEERTEFS